MTSNPHDTSDAAESPRQVHGRSVKIDDIREVFVGTCDETPGEVYFRFRNRDGDDTRIRLSAEAVEAMKTLLGQLSFETEFRWVASVRTELLGKQKP